MARPFPGESTEPAGLAHRNRRTALSLVVLVVLMMAWWVVVAWVRN
jgi:hypothetical protein